MALPANAKITALVCSGRSRPYDSCGMKFRNSGHTSLIATMRPTRKPTTPQMEAATMKLRTIALSYANVSMVSASR